jgi:hypothetical protein
MHHRVNGSLRDHLGDQRIPDVSPNKFGSAKAFPIATRWRRRVYTDDPVDGGIGSKAASQAIAKEVAYARYQDNAAHDSQLRCSTSYCAAGPECV